jgi:hypothetical protein
MDYPEIPTSPALRQRTGEPLILFQPIMLDCYVLAILHHFQECLQAIIKNSCPTFEAFRPILGFLNQ